MIRWSPSSELANLHSSMDRLFEDFFGPATPGSGGQQRQLPTYALPLDVREVEGGYEIQAPVPGFDPDDVEVTLTEGLLKIEAKHAEESSQEKGGYLRREVARANYQRTLQLPADIKEDGIQASFENGVLILTVPKVPRSQPKKIQISGRSKEVAGKAS